MLKVLFIFVLLIQIMASAQTDSLPVQTLPQVLPQIEANSPKFQWNGRITPYFSYEDKPSSRKGYTEFDFADSYLHLNVLSSEETSVHFKWDFSEQEDHLIYGSIRPQDLPKWEMQIGQITNRMAPLISLYWDHDYISTESSHLSERFSYVEKVDQGIAFLYHHDDDMGVQFSFRNGELENTKNEQDGPGKDAEVMLYWKSQDQSLTAAFSHTVGKYENIDARNNVKNSSHLWFGLKDYEKGFLSLSFLKTQNSVDGAHQKIADLIDLTDLGGEVISGQAANVSIKIYGQWLHSTLEKSELLLQQSFLQPVSDWKERTLTGTMIGWNYQIRPQLHGVLLYSHLNYAQDYSSLKSDSEVVYLLSRFGF